MDADARDLVLARRLKLAVRLVVYPLLLGLVALALHARFANAEDEPATTVTWRGVGAGARGARAWTADSRLTAFFAPVAERCADGATFTLRWRADDGALAQVGRASSFQQEAKTGVADDGGAMTYTMDLDATVGDDAVRATLSGTVLWRRAADNRLVRCDTGPVRITLAKAGGSGI